MKNKRFVADYNMINVQVRWVVESKERITDLAEVDPKPRPYDVWVERVVSSDYSGACGKRYF